MTPAEAKETILIHACALDDIFDARQETSFLGSLRPYSGLREENFHEIMQAIKVLTPTLQGEFLDKKVVAALWNICEFSRLWGIDPEGMLRGNNLISPDDVIKLNRWINTISFVIGLILENVSFEDASTGSYVEP